MSTSAASVRRSSPASPSRRHKRKASELGDVAGPSSLAGRSRTTSGSPFQSDYAPSSATSSPTKRQNIPSPSRRNSRQSRTFQIAEEHDQDQDAPYDEDLDADGELDEEYVEEDAAGASSNDALESQGEAQAKDTPQASTSTATPARHSARPKRSNAPNVSYYDLQPLPGASDEEQDEVVTPSIRRRNKTNKLPPTSDVEAEVSDGVEGPSAATQNNTPSAARPLAKAPRRPSQTETIEPKKRNVARSEELELSEEAKQQAKAEKEAHDVQTRWTEEYFEIVEQLPLELHRTFALMRELEGQMQARTGTMVSNMTAYRDARMAMQKLIDDSQRRDSSQDGQEGRKSVRGSSEDEAENLLGGSQGEEVDAERAAMEQSREVEVDDAFDPAKLLDKEARRDLLRSISLAANESVKAAEEKMGLAATAYNGIDRHIRRLDADISKLESSILLGLRTGTEESRGAREALGLPVDDDAIAAAAEGDENTGQEVRTEAETAALTKAAGAANRRASTSETAASGRRVTRTAAKPATSPTTTEQQATRSRSRSASASATRASPTAAATTRATRQKTTSPAPARSARKRKPQPLSPQKGGRRSVATTTPTVISPTTQLPRDLATLMGPDVSEMPIDPTEPTYCYCGQVSFDEMVACDNDDCTIEWFHYACVGLTRQPKKEWFCRFCAPKGWKGEGMDVPPNAIHKPPGWKKAAATK